VPYGLDLTENVMYVVIFEDCTGVHLANIIQSYEKKGVGRDKRGGPFITCSPQLMSRCP
jgi:hypothetical protein